MSYITTTATGTTVIRARKDAAIKAGLATGESFAVRVSGSGKLVHSFAAPVVEEAKPTTKKVEVVEEVGETIRGLVTVAINRTCRKGADHEFRVTDSGAYCYTCDRIAAEAAKAARAAAKAMVAQAEVHANTASV